MFRLQRIPTKNIIKRVLTNTKTIPQIIKDSTKENTKKIDSADIFIGTTIVSITCCGTIGCIYGAYDGYMTHKNDGLMPHIFLTLGASCFGIINGVAVGAIWPFSLGVVLARQFDRTIKDKNES